MSIWDMPSALRCLRHAIWQTATTSRYVRAGRYVVCVIMRCLRNQTKCSGAICLRLLRWFSPSFTCSSDFDHFPMRGYSMARSGRPSGHSPLRPLNWQSSPPVEFRDAPSARLCHPRSGITPPTSMIPAFVLWCPAFFHHFFLCF